MQAIVRKFSAQAGSLSLVLAAGGAMAACAAEVTSEEELAELEGASQSLVPSSPHWVRACTATPSGPSCEAAQCPGGQHVQCWGASCSCQAGAWNDSDGLRTCGSDEHVECSDRGTGMGCYCARGYPSLLPQKPLPAYPLELAATQSDSVAATFARFDDGSVWGWGDGALLDAPSEMLKPKRISLGGKATRIVAGDTSACALLQDGTARCWGTIAGTDYAVSEAVRRDDDSSVLSGLIGLTHGGDHVCGWRADGHVFCWGDGSYSRYGDPDGNLHDFAFEVSAVTDASQVVASWFNTCFLRKTGTVACVGLSHVGQLGTGDVEDPTTAPSPTTCVKSLTSNDVGTAVASDIPGLRHATLLSGGGAGSFCAETRGGTLCWGSNERGLLALPAAPGVTNCFSATATPVKRSEGPYHVFGPANTCLWSPRGRAQCWGAQKAGVLLDGGVGEVKVPQALPFAQNMTSLAIGARHACYAGEGVIRCWGSGDKGRLGNSSTLSTTTSMVAVEEFTVDPGAVGGSVSSLVVAGTSTVGAGCGLFDTGIDLSAGQTFKVIATGTWSLGPGPSYVCGANGTTAFGKWEGMDYGGLIGRIGSGPAFWLGASSTKAAAFGGRLKLGMIDSDCGNNTGTLSVTVTR